MATVHTIDAHAGGEPCRTVIGGLAGLRGSTLGEQRDRWRARFDWIREALMHEPRGHDGMFGALVVPPVGRDSEYGLIFIDPVGYLNGCGHGTLCSVAAWRRMRGSVEAPYLVDNPDGSQTEVVQVDGDSEHATSTLAMPPTVVLEEHARIDECDVGLARCGNTYLLAEAGQVGIPDLQSAEAPRIREAAGSLLRRARDRFPAHVDLEVALYQPLQKAAYATAILFNQTQIDRSPCGTGSSSLLSLLLRRGELRPGDRILTVGPVGQTFQLEAEPASASTPGADYRVLLTGTAFITGVSEWILNERDPLRAGYRFG